MRFAFSTATWALAISALNSVLASPVLSVDHSVQAFGRANHHGTPTITDRGQLTNAERFKLGLPPSPPLQRTPRVTARQSVASPLIRIGTIQIRRESTDELLGYVATTFSSIGVLQHTTVVQDALRITVSLTSTSYLTAYDVRSLNVGSSPLPFLGMTVGYASGMSGGKAAGNPSTLSNELLLLTLTGQSPADQLPALIGTSLINNFPAESKVFRFSTWFSGTYRLYYEWHQASGGGYSVCLSAKLINQPGIATKSLGFTCSSNLAAANSGTTLEDVVLYFVPDA